MKTAILAFATLLAASIMAETATSGVAQVYKFTATVKTTTATKGKITPKNNPFMQSTATVVYREQASATWHGLIWGCDCETALGQWTKLANNTNSVAGAVIWNASSPYDIILLDDMRWHVMNAIEKKGNKCEVAWTIGESDDTSTAFLALSGFGTLGLKAKRSGGVTTVYCTSYIKSVTGTLAGWMPAPTFYTPGKEATCTFCGIEDDGVDETTETADAWNFCPCIADGDKTFTAVSGTWKLAYNSSLSQRLAKDGTDVITKAFTKFPSSVKKAVEEKIATVLASQDE